MDPPSADGGLTGDRGRRTKDERRRTKDEGRKTKDEGRKTKDEGRKTKDERRRTKDEGRKTKDEGRKTKDERRRTKDEGRRMRDTPVPCLSSPRKLMGESKGGPKQTVFISPGIASPAAPSVPADWPSPRSRGGNRGCPWFSAGAGRGEGCTRACWAGRSPGSTPAPG